MSVALQAPDGRLRGLVSTHVDDLAIASGEQFLQEQQKRLNTKYGSVKAQRTPFTHCGCQYAALPEGGYEIDQQACINALQCQEISNTGDNPRPLTAEELTKFRCALGVLTWLRMSASCRAESQKPLWAGCSWQTL
eukprot:s1176_g8.t1